MQGEKMDAKLIISIALGSIVSRIICYLIFDNDDKKEEENEQERT